MSTLEEMKAKLKAETGIDLTKPDDVHTLEKTLSKEFNKTVLPSWGLFIFLESGLVSFLFGLQFLLGSPYILIVGGIVQIVPSATLIIRKMRNGKASGSVKQGL